MLFVRRILAGTGPICAVVGFEARREEHNNDDVSWWVGRVGVVRVGIVTVCVCDKGK